jgi:hypothetical protein
VAGLFAVRRKSRRWQDGEAVRPEVARRGCSAAAYLHRDAIRNLLELGDLVEVHISMEITRSSIIISTFNPSLLIGQLVDSVRHP